MRRYLIRNIIFYAVIIVFFIIMYRVMPSMRRDTEETVNNAKYMAILEQGDIKDATITQSSDVPTGTLTFTTVEGKQFTIYVSDVRVTEEQLAAHNVNYVVSAVQKQSPIFMMILPIIIVGVVFFIFALIMSRGTAGGGSTGQMMNFSKSRARMSLPEDSKVRFADVAGMDEEKQELEEIVDFLKGPEKYIRLGARIPKGVLLVGPPGTGKTLIAKAVAGEAGVPFFSISGSDFVEMYVGVGASRVRDLFSEAKKHHPCIIFIDEIDAVARQRGTGMGGGHDEREQTLNQLLVEMDGFGVNEGIIVLAATNRVDILDPAIRRPGRFDRTVGVGLPDVTGREAILKVHSRQKPLSEDVDLKAIAQTTAGFSGADLENLMNEAAIGAAIAGQKFITQKNIRDAFLKVSVGKEKKSRVISDKEKKITAYHEAGHAILFHVLPDMDPVYTISIVPTGIGAAGYTMPQPENDGMFRTKGMMMQQIIVGLGGRVAEELIFEDITSGASQDIKQVTAIARAMVTQYGMSDKVGLVAYGDNSDEVFIGRDWGHTRNYSEETASMIDEEVTRIINECHKQAMDIIKAHREVLDEVARLLLEKERLNRAEFEAVFRHIQFGEPYAESYLPEDEQPGYYERRYGSQEEKQEPEDEPGKEEPSDGRDEEPADEEPVRNNPEDEDLPEVNPSDSLTDDFRDE